MKFLYMDENYPDRHKPAYMQFYALTGLLVSPENHNQIRSAYYDVILRTHGAESKSIIMPPPLHAAELFIGVEDKKKLEGLRLIVDIVVNNSLEIFRIAYRRPSAGPDVFKEQDSLIGLCFFSMISVISNIRKDEFIFPVMELDRTNSQDRNFAGLLRNTDLLSAQMGRASISIDNSMIGEVLYCTKNSMYGSLVDCVAYILKIKEFENNGVELSDFKHKIAELADQLKRMIRINSAEQIQFR